MPIDSNYLLTDFNVPVLAKIVKSYGRGKDRMLAHITEEEAKLLLSVGGSGTINPYTGLPEFESDYEYTPPDYSLGGGGGSYGYQSPDLYTPSADTGYQGTAAPTQGYQAGYDFYTPSPEAIGQPSAYAPSYAPSYAPTQQIGTGVTAGTPAPGFQPTGAMGFQGPAQPFYAPSPLAYGTTAEVGGQAYPMGATRTTAGATAPNIWDKIATPENIAKIAGAGLIGGAGIVTGRKAAQQAQQYGEEMKGIAKPYQQMGQELIRGAQAGELSPTGQQAIQRLQARLSQETATRGGVGSQQAASQVEAFRQQLLQNQFNYGIQVSQIGDNIALGAIKTGMQADQLMNQTTQAFFNSMAQMLGGTPQQVTR